MKKDNGSHFLSKQDSADFAEIPVQKDNANVTNQLSESKTIKASYLQEGLQTEHPLTSSKDETYFSKECGHLSEKMVTEPTAEDLANLTNLSPLAPVDQFNQNSELPIIRTRKQNTASYRKLSTPPKFFSSCNPPLRQRSSTSSFKTSKKFSTSSDKSAVLTLSAAVLFDIPFVMIAPDVIEGAIANKNRLIHETEVMEEIPVDEKVGVDLDSEIPNVSEKVEESPKTPKRISPALRKQWSHLHPMVTEKQVHFSESVYLINTTERVLMFSDYTSWQERI